MKDPVAHDKLNEFPGLTAEELQAANDLFTNYLFFKPEKGGRRLWTNCCHRDGVLYGTQRTETAETEAVHTGRTNDKVVCPFCGKPAVLRHVKDNGKFRWSTEFIPVMFLRAAAGGWIYAQTYWAKKEYDSGFATQPLYHIAAAYIFDPVRQTAEEWEFNWDNKPVSHLYEKDNLNPSRRKVKEPVATGGGLFWKYCAYHIIGLEELKKTDLKYAGYGLFHQQPALHTAFVKYMATACIYPGRCEMLLKAGLDWLVYDMVEGRRKNATLFKWSENDPRRAFGLDGRTLKRWITEFHGDRNALEVYKQLERSKFKPSLELARELHSRFGDLSCEMIKNCARYRVTPQKLMSYLEPYTGPRCHGAGYFTSYNAYMTWRDYLQAARAIGYDLTVPRVVLPRDLEAAHNEAAAEHNRRLHEAEAKKNAEKHAKQLEGLQRRAKKYSFSAAGYVFIVPQTGQEIVAEGKAQHHCVGGYAARHMEGALTIVFLRREDAPDKSLVTIEMQDNEIRQIHGYQNDRDAKVPPREAYAAAIDPWLAWLKAGSPRDKEGRPKLPAAKKKVKKESAA